MTCVRAGHTNTSTAFNIKSFNFYLFYVHKFFTLQKLLSKSMALLVQQIISYIINCSIQLFVSLSDT